MRDEPLVGGIETQEWRRNKCPKRGEPTVAKTTWAKFPIKGRIS